MTTAAVEEKPAETTPAAEIPAAKPAETSAEAPAETTPAGGTPAAATPEQTTEPARPEGHEPKAPEKYELTLPENVRHLADADLEIVAAEAKALGLTNAQAQALVDAREGGLAAMSAQFLSDAQADPEIGGAKFEKTVEHARAGRDWLFPRGSEGAALVESFFDRSGLGNHKELIRAFARIGRAVAEDRPIGGRTGGDVVERKRDADVLYAETTSKEA